jgi:hypothetical protein
MVKGVRKLEKDGKASGKVRKSPSASTWKGFTFLKTQNSRLN